jgi:tetratricopeptide (TPR) repeat protein
MKLSISDVLDAYRADLSNAGREQLSAGDAAWLAFGTLLQRAVRLDAPERAAYLRGGAARIAQECAAGEPTAALAALAAVGQASLTDDGDLDAALCAAAIAVATDAEVASAFAVATLIIDFTRSLVGLGEFRLQGRLLGQQVRVFRKVGELDSALELCDQIGDIGVTHGDQELIALSHVNRGAIARVRGNNPMARAEFSAVLDMSLSTNEGRDLHVHAHHGLLVTSAIAKDFDAALQHGARALDLARTTEIRTEMLANLASLCYDIGQFRSALHGYLHVLAESQETRVRISAFGGAAVASARLGDSAMVNALVHAATTLVAGDGFLYEFADMYREFSEAYAHLGQAALASKYRDEALGRARAGGFFEISHRLESFVAPAKPNQSIDVSLTDVAWQVAEQLASGDSEELLSAAVGVGQQ